MKWFKKLLRHHHFLMIGIILGNLVDELVNAKAQHLSPLFLKITVTMDGLAIIIILMFWLLMQKALK